MPMHEKGVRTAGDSYYTDTRLAKVLVNLLPLEPGDTVLEPSAGGAAFCLELEARGCVVHAMDIDPRAPALHMPRHIWSTQVGDFTLDAPSAGRPKWVVGNPPYAKLGEPVMCTKCRGDSPARQSCKRCKGKGHTTAREPEAENQVHRALGVATRGVAFLLRLAFLATMRRRVSLWQANPPAKVWVLPQRPSFTGKGTDQFDYGWFVWDNEHQGPTELGWAPPYR